ncbi:MAG: YicC/YloC family endoribonuclease [Vicinamibacterales bacterium]
MTGFAALTREEEQATIAVTLRAVNHRFLDLQARLPASLADMESRLRAIVQERIGRGRVELTVNLQLRRQPSLTVEVNEPLIDALAAALEQARAKGIVTGALQPGDLLRLPQALAIREKTGTDGEGATEDVRRAVEAAVTGAVEQLDVMRGREGSFLRQDLEGRRALLADFVERIAQAAERGREALETRLAERVRELGGESLVEPTAIAQEIVRFVARSDVTEEIVRFRSHLAHWQVLADAPEPCGRKLDFLIQEMNREANTIGSKAEGEEAPPIVVAMKAELEKMREQIQNVE